MRPENNHKEWRKRELGSKLENIYDVKSLNDMNNIHDNKVNNIAECNLLNDIVNTSKCTKDINTNYFPILHLCINTCKGRVKYNSFKDLLDSGFSPTVLMRRITTTLEKRDVVIQYHTQAVNHIKNLNVRIYLTSLKFSVMKL